MRSIAQMKRWFVPLKGTPFHPQWLVLRQHGPLAAWVCANARGLVLDIGCGNGWLREQLDDSARYVGVDYPSTVALGYTGQPDIFADAGRLPIADASCDTVVLLDVIEHLTSPELALSEVHRVLRPGGTCLVHIPFMYPLHDEPHDFWRLTRHGLARVVRNAGLELGEVKATTGAIETAGAMACIALAKAVVDATTRRQLALLLAPAAILAIPFLNTLAWLFGFLLPKADFMPFSYRVIAYKARE